MSEKESEKEAQVRRLRECVSEGNVSTCVESCCGCEREREREFESARVRERDFTERE